MNYNLQILHDLLSRWYVVFCMLCQRVTSHDQTKWFATASFKRFPCATTIHWIHSPPVFLWRCSTGCSLPVLDQSPASEWISVLAFGYGSRLCLCKASDGSVAVPSSDLAPWERLNKHRMLIACCGSLKIWSQAAGPNWSILITWGRLGHTPRFRISCRCVRHNGHRLKPRPKLERE